MLAVYLSIKINRNNTVDANYYSAAFFVKNVSNVRVPLASQCQKKKRAQDKSVKQERARYKGCRKADKKHQSHSGDGALLMHTNMHHGQAA